jgi:hypothetical protein
VRQLRDDLASGRWTERNREILGLHEADLGARLLVADDKLAAPDARREEPDQPDREKGVAHTQPVGGHTEALGGRPSQKRSPRTAMRR